MISVMTDFDSSTVHVESDGKVGGSVKEVDAYPADDVVRQH